MQEHGPLWLVKSSIVQMVQLLSFILAMVPTLVQIVKENSDINLAKVKRLKKMLNEKEAGLVEQTDEVEHWVKKEAEAQDNLKAINQLLLQKEQELEAEWQRMEST